MEQNNEEFKKLLEENLKYSKEILNVTDKIRRHLLMRQVYFYIKLVIFVGLIIFGIITVGPLINRFNEEIKQLFESANTVDELKNSIRNVNDIRSFINK